MFLIRYHTTSCAADCLIRRRWWNRLVRPSANTRVCVRFKKRPFQTFLLYGYPVTSSRQGDDDETGEKKKIENEKTTIARTARRADIKRQTHTDLRARRGQASGRRLVHGIYIRGFCVILSCILCDAYLPHSDLYRIPFPIPYFSHQFYCGKIITDIGADRWWRVSVYGDESSVIIANRNDGETNTNGFYSITMNPYIMYSKYCK